MNWRIANPLPGNDLGTRQRAELSKGSKLSPFLASGGGQNPIAIGFCPLACKTSFRSSSKFDIGAFAGTNGRTAKLGFFAK
jgi:hypothetical protein